MSRTRNRKMNQYNKLSELTGTVVKYTESKDENLSWIASSTTGYHCTDFIKADDCAIGDTFTLIPSTDGVLGKGVYVEFFEADTSWGSTIIRINNYNYLTHTEFGTWGVIRDAVKCTVVDIVENEIVVVIRP